MSEESLSNIIYSKNVVEFVTVANEYCNFIEEAGKKKLSESLSKAQKILPLLYLKATLLPATDKLYDDEVERFVSELDYNIILQKWVILLGEYDSFMEVYEPGAEFSDIPLNMSISENIVDIYQDIKDFITAYSIGNEEVMNDALSECILNFEQYWGQRLVNVLRAIHMLVVSGKDLDEKTDILPDNEIDKDETDWVDGFFSQYRKDI